MAIHEKFALITGATSGIGLELAKLFAKGQYNLVIVARGQEGLDKQAAEIENSSYVKVITIPFVTVCFAIFKK